MLFEIPGILFLSLGFLDVHVLSTQPSEVIAAVCCGMRDNEVNTLSQQAYTDHTCFVHRLVQHPGVVAVQCKVDLAAEQLFSWTEQVFCFLQSPRLLLLAPVYAFKYFASLGCSFIH